MIGGAVLGERLVATFGLEVRWCFMPVSPLVALAVCMHESKLHSSLMSSMLLHADSDADHSCLAIRGVVTFVETCSDQARFGGL